MNKEQFYKNLLGINPAASCLKFLYDRILKDDYRGVHKLQHYRFANCINAINFDSKG